MTLLLFGVPALMAAVLSFVLVRPVRELAFVVGAIDVPGPRKIHKTPMARLGGLAVLTAASCVFAAISIVHPHRIHALEPELLIGIAVGIIPIFVVSFIDDIRGVRARTKLLVHIFGAVLVVATGNHLPDTIALFGAHIRLAWIAVPISVIWIVCVTNAFNIIDGLDGLSAGLATISAVSLAAVSVVTGSYGVASASLILAGALAGFLPYNVYPAKIFLGDTGATAIGFMLACLTLGGGIQSAGLAVALPLLIVGVPLADASIAFLRRFVTWCEGHSKGVFEADSRHIHHRLLALGLNQWRAALTLYTVGAVLASAGLLSLFMQQKKAALLLIAIVVAAFVGIFKLGYNEFAVWQRGSILKIYDAPVLRFNMFVAFIDIGLVVLALYVAAVLKYDDWSVRGQRDLALQLLALLPALTIGVFTAMRVYRCSWRNANVQDVLTVSAATLTAGFAGYIVSAIVLPTAPAFTFFALYTMSLFGLVTTCRVSYRLLCHWNTRAHLQGEKILIYGAGAGGSLALREIQTNSGVPMVPIGFIDDDPTMSGRWVNGYPVLGNVSALENVVMSKDVRGIVVASEKIEISKLRQAHTLCQQNNVWMRRFRVTFADDFTELAAPKTRRASSSVPSLTVSPEQ